MDITLNFLDPQEEKNYGLYSHQIELNLFKRLLYSMMIGSFSGSIYFLITQNYLYIVLGTYMLIQTMLAIFLSKKSIQILNVVAFAYQMEIQTLLAVLITQLDETLQRGTVMIITSAAFQLSICLSIGTKFYLKLFVSLYSITIQILLSSMIESLSLVWIGFALFSLIFSFQFIYYQEYEKRQKYTLHQNAQRIKENLINLIEIPILTCYNNETDLKLVFTEANQCAQSLLKVKDQNSFLKFAREVSILQTKTISSFTKQQTVNQIIITQSLEGLVRKFFRKQIEQENDLKKSFSAYRCRVKHNSQEYLCQLILLNEKQPQCFIYLQRSFDDYIEKTNQKLNILNLLLKRSAKEIFTKIGNKQKCFQSLYSNLKMCKSLKSVERLDQEIFQVNIYFANSKILFNSHNTNFSTKKSYNLIKLIDSILFHFNHTLSQKSITVSFNKNDQNPTIYCNDMLLKQLFYNSIENAIVFAKDKVSIDINSHYDNDIGKQVITIIILNTIDPVYLEQNNKEKYLKLGHLVINKILRWIAPYKTLCINQENNLYSVKFCLFDKL
ncbi:unnamed protein product [Paramecium primaurelia]|uniref:Uncharacterized protein n=1 Tax=Paramecium primaurelia TaxID=5886 RepID=A0A8S1LE57_PARPR|nr:unnamed protein product [Paramecium primaurelia]